MGKRQESVSADLGYSLKEPGENPERHFETSTFNEDKSCY